ncbi:MAG: hypothetical protein NT066_06685 [Candidatus Omnitrophica bacterium]|nr:hypothetical protein [Candidatus Omnitrophota bacterium]
MSLYLNGGPTIGGPTWVSPYADLSILSSIVSIAKNDEISKTAVVQKLNLSGPRLEIWNKFGILIWQDDTNLSDSQIGTIHNGLDALPSKLLKTVNIILWSTNYFLLQTNPSIKTVVITNFYDLPNSSFLSQLFAGIGKVIYSSLTPEEKRTYDQLYWDSIDRPGLAIYPNAYAKDLPFEFRDYMWDSRKYLTWVGYSRQGSTKERFLKKAAFIVRLFAEKGEDGQMYTYIFTVNTDLTITKVRVQLGSDGLPAEATLALMASSQVPMPSLLKKVPEQQSVSADEALHGLGQQPLFIKKMFDELGQRRYGHFGNTAVPASSPAQEPTSAASPKQDTSEASSPAVQSVLYPRERSKMELGFKNSVNIPQLKERVMHYKDMIAQLTITIFPGVVLTEDAKREIIGFIEGLSIPTTIVQLEAGEIGILTRTHFVNILAQTEKLEEFQPLPLPYDTPSINGRIIYSNFLNLAEISQDEQDMLSAEAVLVPTNLNVLNYLTLGALAGRYPHIIDFLISVTKDYAAIDYPKPPILEGLKHLKNMAVIAQETTGWAGAGEQETSRRKLEELNNALDESIALLKKQSGSSPTHASSPAQVQQQMEQPGGIDFRTLPIVTQAIGNLSANLSKLPLERLASVNLDQEWQAIEKMVDSGITPSAERIKEYIQASCVKDALSDIDKVILCISEILRKEEETCCSTDPTLRDILVVFEAGGNIQDLKDVFLGQS